MIGQILEHPLGRPIVPMLPKDMQTLSPSYQPIQPQGSALEGMLREVPGARLYLTQWINSRVLGNGQPQSSTNSPVHVWQDGDEEGECGDFEVLSVRMYFVIRVQCASN
jgi:hypothetical protein